MDGLAGKARDRADVGLTLGLEYATPLSKLRTVRKIERVSPLSINEQVGLFKKMSPYRNTCSMGYNNLNYPT